MLTITALDNLVRLLTHGECYLILRHTNNDTSLTDSCTGLLCGLALSTFTHSEDIAEIILKFHVSFCQIVRMGEKDITIIRTTRLHLCEL